MARVSASRVAPPLLLCAAVLLLYLPLARYTFVQDDWALLHQFRFHTLSSVVAESLSPAGKYFYRPLATLYCRAVYGLFGLNATGFHLLSLLMIAASALLVVRIARLITGDGILAWGSGVLFASASNIHLDPQMWLAGSFDTGALLGGLLCVHAYLKKRFALSALWFAVALAFKESAAMLCVVLLAWTFIPADGAEMRRLTVRGVFGALGWHAAALLAWAAAKSQGITLFTLPDTHPYAARLLGGHIVPNAELFALWALQAVTPLKSMTFSTNGALAVLLAATAAVLLLLLAALRRGSDIAGGARVALLIAVWFLFMLYPALTLRSHFSRYYLLGALPPVAISAMLFWKYALRSVGLGGNAFLACTVIVAGANLADGGSSLARRVSLGIRDGIHASSRDGDNHLIRKATIVHETWTELTALVPSARSGSLLVLEGVEAECFVYDRGVQVWYGDSTLLVTTTVPVGPDSTGMVRAPIAVKDPWNPPASPPVVSVPSSRVIHLRRSDAGLALVRFPGP